MRKLNPIIFASIVLLMYSNTCMSQTIKNFGDAQIHNNAALGVFSTFINEGMLSGESGLMGFYGSNSLELSGSQIPSVFDVEIANENGLYLDIPIEVNNNMNFVFGNIITNRGQPFNYLDLNTNTTYQGESDFSKIDGFIQATVNGSYLFPVGDETFLRPLAIRAVQTNTILKCAYFFENPINLFTTIEIFPLEITEISRNEFWKLHGDASVGVTLSWDERSELFKLTSQIQNLTLVGFHKETKKWLDLGSLETTGTLTEGIITSELFIPNEYEAITFASVREKNLLSSKSYHYLVSPNGDGVNDFLLIPELENHENNRLQIFNRNGRKVFDVENYSNEFNGTDNLNSFNINKDSGLPEGIYFYLVHLTDEEFSFQGFLYLDR